MFGSLFQWAKSLEGKVTGIAFLFPGFALINEVQLIPGVFLSGILFFQAASLNCFMVPREIQ